MIPFLILTVVVGLSFCSLAHDGDHDSKRKPGALPSSALPAEASATNLTTSGWIKQGDKLMQESRESNDASIFERALRSYTAALAQDPKSEEAMLGLAWVYNTRHEFAAGREWAEKALRLNPNLSQAHSLLGDAAIEVGDYEAGLDHYQKALDIRPDLSSYSRAAHVLWLMGDVRGSRSLMQKAIKAGDRHAENVAWCRAELARIHWHDGALLPAEQQVELALQAAPRSSHVLIMAGKVKTAKKEYAQAILFYERAVEIRPSHDALVALGELYAKTSRSNDAEAIYQRVVKFHQGHGDHGHRGSEGNAHGHTHTEGNAQLARFYADQGRELDEALHEAEHAYEVFKNVFVADTLAWCYYKKGLHEKARNAIVEALRWKTPDASIYFHAGMIHAKLGQTARAEKYLLQALNLNPYFDLNYADTATTTLQELSSGHFASRSQNDVRK